MGKYRIGRRRPPVTAVILTLCAVVALTTVASAGAFSVRAAPTVNSSVDFSTAVGHTTADSLGVVSSTYGATPLSSTAQRTVERALDARTVRIPVGYRNGRVTSSAAGSGGTLDVPALVAMYRSWGDRVLVVIGGSTTDVNVRPGDATQIMKALGFAGVDYTAPNEPNNLGLTIQNQIALATMIVREGQALEPGFKLWGPVWSYYNRATIGTFASSMGSSLAGVDYHHYAMGTTTLSTEQALAQTPQYGQEVRELSGDLAAKGLPAVVDVDELNFSWRYQDGTPGGNNRFFTAVSTVWMTSALGHILEAGGRGSPYATQNGPLGMTVQAGQVNPDNRPVSSPMPAYWGIASWTGAGRWPHFLDTFYAATSSDPLVETFAVNNEAGGYNVVVVNKDTTHAKTLSLALTGAGRYTAYRTDPAAPYDPPAQVATGAYGGGSAVGVAIPALTVTVLVLAPGAVPAGAPTSATALRTFGGAAAELTWAPPSSTGGAPITGYQVSRDGVDSTGAGPYLATVGPTARSFTFPALMIGAGYHFSVRAVTAPGPGAAWTSAELRTAAPSRAPTKVQVTGVGNAAARISWSPPYQHGNPPVTGYLVSRDGRDSTGGGAYTATVGPTARAVTLTLLIPRTTYRFSIQALHVGVPGPVVGTTFTTP